MFDFVHKHKTLIQIVLAVIFLPFAFFGVDSYFRSVDLGADIGSVNGRPISQQEYMQSLQERQAALQRMIGGSAPPGLLDTPEVRMAVVDGIVRQRLLVDRAVSTGILVADSQLQQLIAEQPAFLEGGKFSHSRYVEILKRQNMTPQQFENGLRRDLMVERTGDAYRSTAIVSNTVAERLLRINAQRREVSQKVIEPQEFLPEVKLADDAVKQYYDSHQDEFRVPERARVEYLVLSLDSIAAQTEIAAEDVRQHYAQNIKQFAKGEERQASHILITADASFNAEQKAKARAQAENLLQQVRKSPGAFAELAKKNSQDPGSAAKGGDLGYFPRGAMVGPFEDKVFSMKVGELSDIVESQFGFHIIKLTGLKGRGFEDVRKQVEMDLKRQRASKRFSELAEQFSNLAFEQGDSLKPAADALKLQVQNGGWVGRNGADNKLLNNPKLLQAIFSDDVVKNKRNSEVVDVGANTLIAARVTEYAAASVYPLADIGAGISKQLALKQAAQMAAKHGREILAKLKAGETAGVEWAAARTVSRKEAQGYTAPEIAEIFKLDAGSLPGYAGVENPRGAFVLLKVTRAIEGDEPDAARRKSAADELRQVVGQEETSAFVTHLKSKADIKLRLDRLEQKQQP
jgi:peptidyl-prolyl cis-trans isomerase D